MLQPFKPRVNYIKSIIDNSSNMKLQYTQDLDKKNNPKTRINGWIKTYRNQQTIYFMAINDGSTARNIQVIYSLDDAVEQMNQLKVKRPKAYPHHYIWDVARKQKINYDKEI